MHITAGIRPLSFAAVIDGIDGFQLTPSPDATRRLLVVFLAMGSGSGVVVVLFVALALMKGDPIWWLAAVIYLVLSVPADWVLWRVMQPPVLKSDGTTVGYKGGFQSVTVPIADLAVVYLGRFAERGRYTAGVNSYVFGGSDGRVKFATRAVWFRDEDMKAFAARIGVPIRGDFTERVTATVPTPTEAAGF